MARLRLPMELALGRSFLLEKPKRLVLVRKKPLVVGLFLLVFYFLWPPTLHEIFLPAPTHHRIFSRYGFSQDLYYLRTPEYISEATLTVSLLSCSISSMALSSISPRLEFLNTSLAFSKSFTTSSVIMCYFLCVIGTRCGRGYCNTVVSEQVLTLRHFVVPYTK